MVNDAWLVLFACLLGSLMQTKASFCGLVKRLTLRWLLCVCGREAQRNLKFTACLSWTQRGSPRADAVSSPGAWESGGQSPVTEWKCQLKGGVKRLPERRVLGEGVCSPLETPLLRPKGSCGDSS